MQAERKFGSKLILLSASLAFAACSSDLDGGLTPSARVRMLTIDAVKSPPASTRALNPDGDNIATTWSQNDRVTVLNTSNAEVATMTPLAIDGAKARLKAALINPIKAGDKLSLVIPRVQRDYTGQKGTLADIAANYDYATASVEVRYADDTFVSATDAHFTNQQAIARFKLTDTRSQPIKASRLTIAADGLLQNETTTGSLVITPEEPTDEIYAALSGLSGIVTLTASVGRKTYNYTTSSAKTFDNGKFYPVTCRMQKESVAYSDPLTLECFDSRGGSVSVSSYGDLEYRKNDGEWTSYQRQVYLKNGDRVSFRGTESTKTTSSKYMQISCNCNCYIYGNVMSLLSKTDFATMTELPYNNTFQNLFMNNKYLFHQEGKDLVLPAETLRQNCYYQMFSGCISLDYVKCLATDISAQGCTTNWLKSTNKNGTFVKADGFDGWSRGDSGIPAGWKVGSE